MENNLLIYVLVILCFASALNLLLTFRLLQDRKTKATIEAHSLILPIGQVLPAFQWSTSTTGAIVDSSVLKGQAAVLVFLSAGCPACSRAMEELSALMPEIQKREVPLLILSVEQDGRVADLLKDTSLAGSCIKVERSAIQRLNPRRAVPSYIFVDENTRVMASGYTGDDNWLSFRHQLLFDDHSA
jgi:hypothetical protein